MPLSDRIADRVKDRRRTQFINKLKLKAFGCNVIMELEETSVRLISIRVFYFLLFPFGVELTHKKTAFR